MAAPPVTADAFYELVRRSVVVAPKRLDDYIALRRPAESGIADARAYQKFSEWIRAGRNCVLNDVSWCEAEPLARARRELAELAPDHRVKVIYFENDPVQCLANAELRAAGIVDPENRAEQLAHDLAWIKHRTKIYATTPPGSLVVPVWRPEG